jgi:hypothetical protein
MAVVLRYFSTTGAGAADGTSWANRAALLSAGTFSTIITGFNFAGTDSLECIIGAGTYAVTSALVAGSFANAPSAANPLIFQGADSSGNKLTPPSTFWTSDTVPTWTSALPVITTSSNIATVTLSPFISRFISWTASARNGVIVSSFAEMDWCFLQNSTANTAAGAINSAMRLTNCWVDCPATSYAFGIQVPNNSVISNCRVSGVTGTTGNRYGIEYNGTNALCDIDRCCVYGHGGQNIVSTATNAGQPVSVTRTVSANSAGNGILFSSTALQTAYCLVSGCMLTGNTGSGVNAQTNARVIATGNRARNNAAGDFTNFGNYPVDFDNNTAAGTDANEYVDAPNFNFQIKYGSTVWGKGYGVSDQTPTGGGLVGRLVDSNNLVA